MNMRDLQNRKNALCSRIVAIEAYKSRHGVCDERALTLHRRELSQVVAEITAERRAWETAHPRPTPTPVRARAADPVAPVPRRAPWNRSEFLDRASHVLLEDTARLSYGTLRDLALRNIESRSLPPAAEDRLDSLVRERSADCDGKLVARWIVVTGSPGYEELFRAALQYKTMALSPRGAAAMADYRDLCSLISQRAESRAMSEGTNSAGGFGVPYYLDPTLVPTSGLAVAQILPFAKTVITTSNAWHGVAASTTGFTTTAEGAAAAEDDPVLAQPGTPSIPLYKGTDWLPFSIELGMDQPGWVDNAGQLFADSYAEYISNRTAVGSGVNNPTGVFTAMTNATTSPAHVVVTTAGTLGAVDLRAVWAALPERYRVDPTCAWVMSPSVEDRVSALSAPSQTNGLGPQDFTVDPNTGQRRLFGRPIVSIADAPALTGTTGAENFCVVGAFSRFVVASRVGGYQAELVPNVPDFNNGGRPSGNRGFLATVRAGSNVLNADAFRLLANS